MNNVKKVIQLTVITIWLNFSPYKQHIRWQCDGVGAIQLFVCIAFLQKGKKISKTGARNGIVDFVFWHAIVCVCVFVHVNTLDSIWWCRSLSFIYHHHICSFLFSRLHLLLITMVLNPCSALCDSHILVRFAFFAVWLLCWS